MSPALLTLLLLAPAADPRVTPEATRALHRFFPCTPGLTITYEVESKPSAPGAARLRFTDTVKGPGKGAGTCVIERVTPRAGREDREPWARELLPDRVSHMGWADQPLALRPPLLVLPLEVNRRWTFNTTRYVLEVVGAKVELPAGAFADTVRVRERSVDGTWDATSVYAPDVGLVLYETPRAIQRAVKVERPPLAKRAPRGG